MEKPPSIRVAIADDFVPMRKQIASVLAAEPSISIVGDAGDGVSAIRIVRETMPEVLLLDISLPDINGFEVAREIRKLAPSVRILFLSEHYASDWNREAFEDGAYGMVLKSEAFRDLIPALHAVARGERFTSPCPESVRVQHANA